MRTTSLSWRQQDRFRAVLFGALTASLLLTSLAQAATYYVATNGSDSNAGTQASPFRTIQKGVDVAVAGDTVNVAAGVYQERITINHGGTPAQPITIQGAAGAIIDGSSNVTLNWTLLPGGQGIYAAPVPFDANTVVVDGKTVIELYWETVKPQPWPFDQVLHPYHYQRLFTYGFANVSGLPNHTVWGGVPEGWDGIRALSLYVPSEGRLWLKLMPGGNGSTPQNPATRDVKVAPVEATVVTMDGADDVILRGFQIKNGFYGIKVWNTRGAVIENNVIVPCYNGIRLGDGANGIVIRNNELSNNHYGDTSTKSRASNVWHINKDTLSARGNGDKGSIWILNSDGNHHISHNYIHDAAVGIATGWHGTPAEEALYNANIEFNNNLIRDMYQDAWSIGANATNHKWHNNLTINPLQHIRFFGLYHGPAYVYNNIFLTGPGTQQSIVHFSTSGGLTPHLYFYNNTIVDPSDTPDGFIAGSVYVNNIFDGGGPGSPNYHYYNNLFYADRFFKMLNGGTDANWDGNYNAYIRRGTAWETDLGQSYATGRGIDLNSLWSTASPGFTNFGGNNVSLTSSSPARNVGTNLTTRFGFTPPGGGSTDAGALPFGTAMPTVPGGAWGVASTPYITTIEPSTGPTSGGTVVHILGTNLTGASVSFGGTPASSVTVQLGGTHLTAVAPARSAGNANVSVTTSAGTSNSLVFTYASSFNATFNPVADSMVASGQPNTNYGTGNNMQTQHVNGVWPIMKFDIASLQGSPVTNAVLRVHKISNNASHVIAAYSATSDSWTETGVNWNNKPAQGASLATATTSTPGYYEWNVTSFVNTQFAGDKIVTLYLVESGGTGIWSQWGTKENTNKPQLVVTTGSGGPAAPTLSSISPSSGPTAGGTVVTITGTNLTGTSNVSFGGTAATNVSVNGAGTQITATSPARSAGTISVTATTPGGTSNGVNFTYNAPAAPTLTSVTPNAGTTAGGTSVTLVGTNLTGTTNVSFGGTAATNVSVNGAGTQITATTPARSAGAISVTATTPNGTSNGVTYTYVVPAPALTSITPNSGTTAGGTSVTLVGTNLIGATNVSFGGTAATNVTVNGAGTQITCTTPARAAGAISVTVTTPGGTSNGVTYTYTTGTPFNVTLNPVADSMVASNASGSNYGTGSNMQTLMQWGNVWIWPIIKFDLTGVSGTTITNAKLRVYKNANGSSHGINVFSGASDTWTETGVNWNNKPAKGSSLATQTVANSGYYEWDITSFVNGQFGGDKIVTLYMTDENNVNIWSQWSSKEATNKPQLVLSGN